MCCLHSRGAIHLAGSPASSRCRWTGGPSPAVRPMPGRYSMTWSARTSRDGGTVSPSALAVLRLMTSSDAVGCSTRRSAGLAPPRARPKRAWGRQRGGWPRGRCRPGPGGRSGRPARPARTRGEGAVMFTARRGIMHRVFALDVHACRCCRGRLRGIATVQDSLVVQAILAHLRRSGAPSRLAMPHPPRPQSRLLARSGPRSLTLPPAPALTASPRRRRITGGQRARLTPTLAFAPSTAPFRAPPGAHGGGRTASTPAPR